MISLCTCQVPTFKAVESFYLVWLWFCATHVLPQCLLSAPLTQHQCHLQATSAPPLYQLCATSVPPLCHLWVGELTVCHLTELETTTGCIKQHLAVHSRNTRSPLRTHLPGALNLSRDPFGYVCCVSNRRVLQEWACECFKLSQGFNYCHNSFHWSHSKSEWTASE